MAAIEHTATAPPIRGSKILLLVALVLAFIAAAMNWLYLSRLEASTITVLKVRNQPVLAGTPVSKSMFEPIRISGNLKQLQSLVLTESEFPAFDQKPVAETLQPGQLLMLRSFELTSGNSMRDSIRSGERALSLNVADEAGAVAYFVRPGDSVDIWGRVGGSAYRFKERACVKAVGESHVMPESTRDNHNGVTYRTITVLVAENDVPSLIQNVALSSNEVTLSLVGACDMNAAPIPAMTPLIDPKAKAQPPLAAAAQKPSPAARPVSAPPTEQGNP